MRTFVMSLLFVLTAATAASATEATPPEAARADVIPAVVAADAPAGASDMRLDRVSVREHAGSADAAAAQLGPRGGFWWMVGVVVVAGVILAAIL